MATTAENMQDNMQLDVWLDKRLDELLPKKLEEIETSRTPSMSIIATKGSLDWAYPPFILASTAAALGWDVDMFFTFYGLLLLKKDIDAEVSPLGNPAMPMKMPFGPQWFQDFDWPMPNLLMAGVPGFEKMATGLMKKTFKNKGVASRRGARRRCSCSGCPRPASARSLGMARGARGSCQRRVGSVASRARTDWFRDRRGRSRPSRGASFVRAAAGRVRSRG